MTKLKFLVFFLLVASFVTMQAQVGVKLGGSLSKSGSYGNTEDGESADFKLGFQGGLFYNLNVSEKMDIMVELNYESRGTVSKKDYMIGLPVQDPTTGTVLGIGNYSITQEANSVQTYINLPILAVFGGEKFKYYVGPNVGFLLSGTAEFTRTIDITLGGNPAGTIKTDLEEVDWQDYDSFKNIFTTVPSEDGDFLNSVIVGINLGAMYSISESMFVDLRVSQELTDSTNDYYDDSIYPSDDFSFESRGDSDRNLSFQLSIGYKF
ncbi:MAG: outer membrane beta-barrel protein [Chitinophagales bacterium]